MIIKQNYKSIDEETDNPADPSSPLDTTYSPREFILQAL